MKKGFAVAGALLIVVGALLFAAAFIGSGADFSKPDTKTYETNTYEISETFDSADIRTAEADVTFRPSEDGKTRVDCRERKTAAHRVAVENGTLFITVSDDTSWADRLTLFSFQPQTVTVYLPAGRYAALNVSTDTGDVDVPEQFSFGDATVTTDTGDVSFAAAVDGALTVGTDTGDLSMRGVIAGSIGLTTSTGKIEGEKLRCKDTISVRVDTGDAVLTNTSCKRLTSAGSTGDLTLKNVLASEAFSIERDTGDVRFESCDAGRIAVTTSTGDVTGTLRSEKTFVTKTSTGDIRVPASVPGSVCEITTSTGDVRIDLTKTVPAAD